MFIKINDQNKVIFKSTLKRELNEIDSFLVKEIPLVEVGKQLCFNPETREFYQEDIPNLAEYNEKQKLQDEAKAIEKEENAFLAEALKIMVEEHSSNTDKWKSWARNYEEKKNAWRAKYGRGI